MLLPGRSFRKGIKKINNRRGKITFESVLWDVYPPPVSILVILGSAQCASENIYKLFMGQCVCQSVMVRC